MSQPTSLQCRQCGRTVSLPAGQSEFPIQCSCGAKISILDTVSAAPAASAQPKNPAASNAGAAFDDASGVQPVDFGLDVPCAYQPSGVAGNLAVLSLYGVLGTAAAFAVGLVCGLVAFGITYGHSLLPVYIFIVPILVLLLVAVTPGIAGAAAGLFLTHGVVQAKCRNKGIAQVLTLAAGSVGVVLLILVADQILSDGLLHFIRLLVGGSFHLEWGANFQPIHVPAWIIYGVIIVSGVCGVFVGAHIVTDKVASTPYCENCARYLDENTLWSVMPNHLEPLRQALDDRDMVAAQQIPPCPEVDNRVDVTLWSCDCNGDQFVELFGRTVIRTKDGEQRKEPVRVYSAALTVSEARQLIGE